MDIRNYSRVYRIMHWTMAICLLLILLTIFLRLTWLNKNNVAAILAEQLAARDVSLPQDELISIAKKIRKPMWDWHIYLGYVFTGLYVLRFLLPLWDEMKLNNPFAKNLSAETKFRFWVYLVFYVCLAVSLITGLLIEFGPKAYKKPIESVHVLSIYYLVAFMVIHLAGVLRAEFTGRGGIVSSVISGTRKKEG